MIKNEGMHFYINILNLDKVVLDEELKTGKVNHSIHALDTFFSMIESFGKLHFPEKFIVEKITGSRLHMYVTGTIEEAFQVVSEVSVFAYRLTSYLNNDIPKYKTLLDFRIQVGACYGEFYEFTFTSGDFEEDTTIGYVANYAAKLQGLSSVFHLSISANIYENLDHEVKLLFSKVKDDSIKKYEQEYYATAKIASLKIDMDYSEDLKRTRDYANDLNLSAINFGSVRQALNFSNLSKKDCKKLNGIPFFADVRDFTRKFEKDDSNLEEMSQKTQEILETMYGTVIHNRGIHVQFQGDREMALFHDYTDYNCVKDAIVAGMRLIDKVHDFQVCIGIGTSQGSLFAAKIGARGEKDNILLGSTVMQADRYEDQKAGENQIVITERIYQNLRKEEPVWAKQFEKIGDDCYMTTVGYQKMLEVVSRNQLMKNTRNNTYNGAWGE